jgi:uroporphyrinogen decarboxylase
LRVPHECLSVDTSSVNDFCRESDKFVLPCCCPRPFERLQFLRGTENLMMDIALQEPEFKQLVKIVHGFHLEEMHLWAKTNVDALMFMDDWGTQRSLLISPDSWRQIFKPLYKDYIDIARSHGKKIFMHSDGFTIDIIDDLIDLGLDALNAQIFCMGVEEIGKRFAGRITFWGEIDRQNLLPHGSSDEIIHAVKTVYKNLYRNGGVIAQCEFGPGAKPENVMTVFETWASL